MSIAPKDPLLTAARFISGAAMALCAFAGGVITLVIPVLLLAQSRVLAEISSKGAPSELMGAVLIIMVGAVACCVLGFFFFRHLWRMIGTVAQGDPFTPANADRLRAMGWIVVGAHIAAIPMVAMAEFIQSVSDKVESDAVISPGGILLALVLFILARVFRKGAEMRADLQATV